MAKSKLNLDFLNRAYFVFDEPVPYSVENGTINISPIKLRQSEIFLVSSNILAVNKNELPSVEIIQMSYLEFVIKVLLSDRQNQDKLVNILKYCLNIEKPSVIFDEKGKPSIVDNDTGCVIKSKHFEDIRRIIMYQNILHYDDKYMNPELKKAIAETNELKNKNLVIPSLERKMAIITAHCGITKKEQLEMTYRSHSMLFEEVCGEIEFTTTRAIALYRGTEIDHWIFKKIKNKFDGYITNIEDYANSMGASSSDITVVNNNQVGNQYQLAYDSFKK